MALRRQWPTLLQADIGSDRLIPSLPVELRRQVLHRGGECTDFLFTHPVDLLVQELDFEFGFDVDLGVARRLLAVDLGLPVLTHHDGGRGVGRLKGEDEVQEDEGVGIPGLLAELVPTNPSHDQEALQHDERPRAHGGGDAVGHALAQCGCWGRARVWG